MTDENGNLMIIESKTRKKAIDILSYMIDLQKRCFSWPEYKTFPKVDARLWKVLYVHNRTKKDLIRLSKLIHENIDKAPDKLKGIYRKMREGIDYRLHYELASHGKTHDIYGICPVCGNEVRSSMPNPSFHPGDQQE